MCSRGPAIAATAIILAAGKGTRMRSARPKVIHTLAGQPMIAHVLAAAREVGATGASGEGAVVVLGHEAAAVRAILPRGVHSVIQEPQRGTGDAVRVALGALPETADTALILYGDMPLLRPQTLRALLELHARDGHPLSLLSAVVPDPYGYGRVRRDAGRVIGVTEQKELTPDEERIGEINCGVYCAEVPWLRRAVAELPRHSDGEYYLPDLVPAAVADGGVGVLQLAAVGAAEGAGIAEVQGVNTRVQLATAERILRARINEEHMRAGVTLVDPATTYIEPGVRIGPDTVVHPNTHLRGATVVETGCEIGPDSEIVDSVVAMGARVTHSVLEGARVGPRCRVGPFAHLRHGTVLVEDVEIGNYAEVKNATIGAGSVSHHVSYIGDATIGTRVNVGAGTITCNYDGVRKHQTVIGDNVFVGCDTLLRAPVTLGDGSRTGAGAVVLSDVAPGTTVAGVPARLVRSREES